MAIRYLDEQAAVEVAPATESLTSSGRVRFLDESPAPYGILAPNVASPLQQSATEALPFYGSPTAFKQGYQTGQDVLGENFLGKALGSLFGGAMAIGTVANPIVKGAGYYPALAQALGEITSGVDENLASQTLVGQRPVIPTFAPGTADTGSQALNTAINFATDVGAQAANDPVNAALLIEAARSPQTIQTIKGLPRSIADAATFKGTRAAIAERGVFKQPLAAATTEAIGVTPAEGSQALVPVIKSSILEANNGTIPKNVAPQQVIQNAMDYKINQYKEGLKLAEDQGLAHSSQSLVKAMESNLVRDYPLADQAQITSIIESTKSKYPKLFSQDYISPVEGQKGAVQINRVVNDKNPNRVPQTNEQLTAQTALSQELSRQGSEMYQASTRTTATPNQDWGVLSQTQEGLLGQLKIAQSADAGKNPGGSGLSLTKGGVVGKALKKIGGRALVPTNAENVGNSFQRMLNEGEGRPVGAPIDPAFQQGIINQYTPRAAAAPTAAAPVAPTFEQRIQAIVQKLPREMRGSNERSLAEAILRAQQTPVSAAPLAAPIERVAPSVNPLGQAVESPIVTNISNRGSTIDLQLDATGKMPTGQDIRNIIQSAGLDASVVRMQPSVSDLAQGKILYRIDAVDKFGNSSTKSAQEIIDKIFGGKASGLSKLEQTVSPQERLQKAMQALSQGRLE